MRHWPSLLAAGGLVATALPAQPQFVSPMTAPATRGCPSTPVPATAAERAAREFYRPQRHGRELYAAVRRVWHELDWHRRLDKAAEAARASGKPILWIQALGKLRGYT